jgi:phospholipid/cholesterol/gamma-HCH transport system permease protein
MKSSPLKNIALEAGNLSHFIIKFFKEVFKPKFEFAEFIRQCYFIGNKTVPLIAVTGFIIGLVVTIQSYPSLEVYGTESWMPSVVSVSLVRELIPVITALICAGKIASGIGAELGSMKVSEQIDAMEISSANPFKYLVVTRVLATALMLPLLMIICDSVALFGAFLGVNMKQNSSFLPVSYTHLTLPTN